MSEKIQKIKNQFPILNTKLHDMNRQKTHLDDQLAVNQTQTEKTKSDIGHLSNKKENLIRSRGDGPIGVYGSNLLPLMEAIQRTRWLGQTPLGPLGLHVKLKDSRWQALVEANLGASLSSFAVTKQDDVATLRNLFRQFQHSHRSSVLFCFQLGSFARDDRAD